ncbi:hypothetical protein CRYUN_Cryun14cG0010300 [Craigia yunnanensis]
MEPRLFEATRSGDISAFHSLLGEDPFLLDRVALNSVDNPLHVSALTGQTEITKEIVSRKPAFARELNENGFSPMHVASANGRIEIIRELMRVGYGTCLLKGKDGKVPLHCAALCIQIMLIHNQYKYQNCVLKPCATFLFLFLLKVVCSFLVLIYIN